VILPVGCTVTGDERVSPVRHLLDVSAWRRSSGRLIHAASGKLRGAWGLRSVGMVGVAMSRRLGVGPDEWRFVRVDSGVWKAMPEWRRVVVVEEV